MSFDSLRPIVNGTGGDKSEDDLQQLNVRLDSLSAKNGEFHGDKLLADKQRKQTGLLLDLRRVFTFKNAPEIFKVLVVALQGKGLDVCTMFTNEANHLLTIFREESRRSSAPWLFAK